MKILLQAYGITTPYVNFFLIFGKFLKIYSIKYQKWKKELKVPKKNL